MILDNKTDEIDQEQLAGISNTLADFLYFDPVYYDAQTDANLWHRKRKIVDTVWPLHGKRLTHESFSFFTALLFGIIGISVIFLYQWKIYVIMGGCVAYIWAYFAEYLPRFRLEKARHHHQVIEQILRTRGFNTGPDTNDLFDFLLPR